MKTALSDLDNQETKRYFTHKGQKVLKNVPIYVDGYKIIRTFAVPDPDLEIREKLFSALRASVWSKNKGAPLPWIRHCFGDILRCAEVVINIYILHFRQ